MFLNLMDDRLEQQHVFLLIPPPDPKKPAHRYEQSKNRHKRRPFRLKSPSFSAQKEASKIVDEEHPLLSKTQWIVLVSCLFMLVILGWIFFYYGSKGWEQARIERNAIGHASAVVLIRNFEFR